MSGGLMPFTIGGYIYFRTIMVLKSDVTLVISNYFIIFCMLTNFTGDNIYLIHLSNIRRHVTRSLVETGISNLNSPYNNELDRPFIHIRTHPVYYYLLLFEYLFFLKVK